MHQHRISIVVAEEAALKITAAVRVEVIDVDNNIVGSGNVAGAFILGSPLGFVGAVPGSAVQVSNHRTGVGSGGQFLVKTA